MDKTILETYGLTPVKLTTSKQNPDKCDNDKLVVGLELEIEGLPRGQDHYAKNAGKFWTVVEDGSLRPRGEAWEFVSQPAPLGVMLAELRIFFEKFKFDDANYSDRCSVHVHTNVQDFTLGQLANVALVYPVVEAVLFQFINFYNTKNPRGYSRNTNLYCIPWSDCRLNRNFIEKILNTPEVFTDDRAARLIGDGRSWKKYTALNMLPVGEKGTIEWRHMHGTADTDKLFKWLHMIAAIMKYCQNNKFDDIVKQIKVLNDVSTYQQFFTDIFGQTLPYAEEYRGPMAEGVLNAKYSLINWEKNKEKKKDSKKSDDLLHHAERFMQWEPGDLNVVHEWNNAPTQVQDDPPVPLGEIRWNTVAQQADVARMREIERRIREEREVRPHRDLIHELFPDAPAAPPVVRHAPPQPRPAGVVGRGNPRRR